MDNDGFRALVQARAASAATVAADLGSDSGQSARNHSGGSGGGGGGGGDADRRRGSGRRRSRGSADGDGKDAHDERRRRETRYRDRAAERRKAEGVSTGAGDVGAASESGAEAGQGEQWRFDPTGSKETELSAEQTKYLGGDVEHTHLVRGLDYQLLDKVRAQMAGAQQGGAPGQLAQRLSTGNTTTPAATAMPRPKQFASLMARAVWRIECEARSKTEESQRISRSVERFIPGRWRFVLPLGERDAAFSAPASVLLSRDDCPAPADVMFARCPPELLEKVSTTMKHVRLGKRKKRRGAPTATPSSKPPQQRQQPLAAPTSASEAMAEPQPASYMVVSNLRPDDDEDIFADAPEYNVQVDAAALQRHNAEAAAGTIHGPAAVPVSTWNSDAAAAKAAVEMAHAVGIANPEAVIDEERQRLADRLDEESHALALDAGYGVIDYDDSDMTHTRERERPPLGGRGGRGGRGRGAGGDRQSRLAYQQRQELRRAGAQYEKIEQLIEKRKAGASGKMSIEQIADRAKRRKIG